MLFGNSTQNMTLPVRDDENQFLQSSINFLFVTTDYCRTKNSNAYCNYSVFIIFLGYMSIMLVFPFLLHRMRQLNNKFRNQYNISLLWLASISLVFSIDLIEFFLVHDGRLYSAGNATFQLVSLITCLLTMIQYFRNYSSVGSLARNILILLFMIITFIVAFTGRILSKKSMSNFPNLDQISPISFHIINTHFFFYFFIYGVFAIVQVNKLNLKSLKENQSFYKNQLISRFIRI